jgi:hypothetical protein
MSARVTLLARLLADELTGHGLYESRRCRALPRPTACCVLVLAGGVHYNRWRAPQKEHGEAKQEATDPGTV